MRRHTEKDFSIGDRDYCVSFDWDVTHEREANYGADADGNRGIPIVWREAELDAITGIEPYDDTEVLIPETRQALTTLVEAYINTDDSDPDWEDDGPDPDRARDEALDDDGGRGRERQKSKVPVW